MHFFVLVWQELMWILKYFKGCTFQNDKILNWSSFPVEFVANDKIIQFWFSFFYKRFLTTNIKSSLEEKSSYRAMQWHFLTTVVFYSAIKSIFHIETHLHVLLQWRLFVDWRSFLVKIWWIPCVKTEEHQDLY